MKQPFPASFRRLLLLGLATAAWPGYAQTLARAETRAAQQPAAPAQTVTLPRLLDALESRYGVRFNYRADRVRRLSVPNQPLEGFANRVEQTLNELLAPLDWQCRQLNATTFVVQPRPTSPADAPQTRPETGTQPLVLEKITGGLDEEPRPVPDREVSGTITDAERNEPLPGVSVAVKGTTRGTTTDARGQFRLSVPDGEVTLTLSSVGYESQDVVVGNQTALRIALKPNDQTLNEVVVVGYGTQERRDVTGSVSSVKAEQIQAFPVVSVDRALQGRAPGVQVLSNTGQPGGGMTIRIRGVGTVNNNDPLYVIDGVPVFNDPNASSGSLRGNAQLQNPLSMINPNDIESMEILKDASATAIYGSRANNGVVLITTRRGKEGKLRVNYEGFGGTNRLQSDFNQMNAQQWAGFVRDLLVTAGQGSDVRIPELQKIADDPNTPTYDWAAEAIRPGQIQSHQLGFSGGTKASQFFISGNYYDESGTFINSGFKRYAFRLNSDHRLNDKLKTGNTLTLSRTDQRLAWTDNGNNALFVSLNRQIPVRPIYLDDGRYAAGGFWQDNQHPIAGLKEDKETLQTLRILGSVYGEYQILPGLSFRTAWSVDQIRSTQELFQPPYDVEGGSASRLPAIASLATQNRDSFTWFTDNYFTFRRKLADAHDLTATGGISAQQTSNRNYGASVSNFFSGNYPYLGAGINQGNVSGAEVRNALFSYFARANYAFRDRYLLTATLRRDGSSRFGADNRFGTFPAVSVGWRLSEEPFLKSVSALSNLKLRASWGKSGGQEIGDYTAFSILATNYNYVLGNTFVGGVAPLSLANPRLQWEATVQSNIGLDAAFLNGRFGLTADYFIRNTTKLLLRTLTPLEQGAVQNPFSNQGEIKNQGIELSLNAVLLEGPVRWSVDANFTSIHNRVLSLANGNAPRLTTPVNANFAVPTFVTQVGDPIGRFLLYETTGVFQTWEEIYAAPRQNTPLNADGKPLLPQTNVTQQTSPGDLRFRDADGNGVIDPNDRVVVGKIIPDFTWGMTHEVTFKGLSLSVFLLGVQGVDIYNGLRSSQERANLTVANFSRSLLDSWRPDNPSVTQPRAILQDPNFNNRASTRFLEDGSFVRVKNVRLAYNLPAPLLSRVKLSAVQLYFSGVNLLTFTKYTGLDPELGNQNQAAEIGNYDAGQYPVAKQYVVGLKLGF